MTYTEELIKVNVSNCNNRLQITYKPVTERTVFDVCDVNGRILKTGSVKNVTTKVEVSDLETSRYVLLILDGDRVYSQKFRIVR